MNNSNNNIPSNANNGAPTSAAAAASGTTTSAAEQQQQQQQQQQPAPMTAATMASSATVGTSTSTKAVAGGGATTTASYSTTTSTAPPGSTVAAAAAGASTSAAAAVVPPMPAPVPVVPAPSAPPPPASPPTTDQVVLDYLRRKGMSSAVLELTNLLKKQDEEAQAEQEQEMNKSAAAAVAGGADSATATTTAANTSSMTTAVGSSSNSNGNSTTTNTKSIRARLEEEDELNRAQRSLLTKSTGGGYGYDLDSAWPIVQWGIPDVSRNGAAGTTAVDDTNKQDDDSSNNNNNNKNDNNTMGLEEARAYLDAFVNLQLWVLTLPDVDGVQCVENPLRKAQKLLKQHQQQAITAKDDGNAEDEGKQGAQLLQAIVQELSQQKLPLSSSYSDHNGHHTTNTVQYNLATPGSVKPELLAVTFALLVHTYCEILEVGCESTAHLLRDAFYPVYEPLYFSETRDLYHCTTTEQIMRLNQHNSQHMESLAQLKQILVQVASYQLRREELMAQAQAAVVAAGSNNAAAGNGGGGGGGVNNADPQSAQSQAAREKKIKEYERNIGILQSRYTELSARASAAFDKMHDLPFLRRARAVRWQLSLSTQTYALLASFLNSGRGGHDDDALLAMSTLLQTKCILNVERRDPLPYTPATVLDSDYTDKKSPNSSRLNTPSNSRAAEMAELNQIAINWAAPSRSMTIEKCKKAVNERIPFPKYHLDDEYDDAKQAQRDRRIVEFNRSLLINGFRRLEALERKRDYESLTGTTRSVVHKRPKEGGGGDADGGLETAESRMYPPPPGTIVAADPLEPTIHLTTLCAASSTPVSAAAAVPMSRVMTDAASIWDEPGVGICCAKICPPDGRRVAAGCDDSAIRIWNLAQNTTGNGNSATGEPCEVLLGHKNGFPVFDVAWNRDGRTLLSAGGDGSIRLWDTMAVGPFGEVSTPVATPTGASKAPGSKSSGTSKTPAARNAANSAVAAASTARGPDMSVPGLKGETAPYQSGAAIAVYRGHVPSTPVWSVAFAPCGYYFASAGADGTARLWTTDRSVPVRLFSGHTAGNVNCVAWHPNANYIITVSDDKTCRLWDIQTGRTVRLLTGCSAGLNAVCISPEGRLAAAADHSGCVHTWDLSTGKKMCELRFDQNINSGGSSNPSPQSMIHSLCFSGCGTTLAAGGDDCCVRVWDVRSDALEEYNAIHTTPAKSFRTRRTMLLDLQYTSRNLLLSVGKFITPVPMATRIPP